jgi:hypothetical protein
MFSLRDEIVGSLPLLEDKFDCLSCDESGHHPNKTLQMKGSHAQGSSSQTKKSNLLLRESAGPFLIPSFSTHHAMEASVHGEVGGRSELRPGGPLGSTGRKDDEGHRGRRSRPPSPRLGLKRNKVDGCCIGVAGPCCRK